jgi:hypothetical protein
MVSLKLLQTVGASILAFTSKGKILVERDSASGPGFSCSKQSGESARCKFSVAHRMVDVLVPDPALTLCEASFHEALVGREKMYRETRLAERFIWDRF